MIPEAPIQQTDAGLVPAGAGWFVLNARDARWRRREGRGHSLPFTGIDDSEVEANFPQLGVNLVVVGPGEPTTMYHWEADAEDFLVLGGEGLLIVEGQERPVKQWDFVHCPAGTKHGFVGAGDGPFVLLAIGARGHRDENCNGGAYVVDEAALRHGAGVVHETDDAEIAYARFPPGQSTRYRDGWLPSA